MSNEVNPRLAIVLVGYDPYREAFDLALDLFGKYWSDCKYPFVIANNTLPCEFENATIIHCGDEASLGERVLRGISEVKAKYCIVFEDDHFITNYVKNDDVEQILDFMDKEELFYYKYYSGRKPRGKKYLGMEHAHYINANEPYGINSTGIYRTDYLIEFMDDGKKDGWDFESMWSELAGKGEKTAVKNVAADDRNLFHLINGISGSRWVRSAVKKLNKMGYHISFEKVPLQSRQEQIIQFAKGKMTSIISTKYRYRLKHILSKRGWTFKNKY